MSKKNRIYSAKVKPIVDRLNKRDYRVGLDLGVGSIGYAVGALEKNTDGDFCVDEIVLSGSRIFEPSKGAADRRLKRGQRNSLRHRHNRLNFLWKILAEKELMLPFCKDTNESDTAVVRFSKRVRTLKNTNPYSLRLKGLTEKLELDELGYSIYHIANHRGSSSVRSFLDVSQEEQNDIKIASDNAKRLNEAQKKFKCNTFVELLFAMNKEVFVGYRNRKERKNVPIPTRDVILNELNKLLEIQKQYYPQILDEKYCERIINAVDYENEKLVPESGFCPFFPKEKKLPKCHFLNEERRLWEALNNTRVFTPYEKNGQKLTLEEKQILFKELRSGKALTPASVKKLIPAYSESEYEIVMQGRDKKTTKIDGFRFTALEEKQFWKRLSEIEQDDFLATWVNCPDDRKLKKILIDKFHLAELETDDAMQTVALIGDYAPVGKSAMKILMKFIIEQGLSWGEAITLAEEKGELKSSKKAEVYKFLPYYGEVLTGRTAAIMGKAWHSAFEIKRDSAGFKKPNTAPYEEKYGKIANPVVHQTLNELRKVVNEMIDIFGYAPAEIAVEVGRELKVGMEERDKISRNQANAERERQRIFNTYCVPHGLSAKYIRHFQMGELQSWQCPYCLKTISPSDIASHSVDIDHVLPEEDTFDSSFNNLVLSHNVCNEEKGKRTPFAAYSGKSIWKDIVHYIDATSSMHFKKWRFLINDSEYAEYLKNKGFLSRYKTDNAYIAKVAREYLACLYPQKITEKSFPVQTFKGGETAVLRKAWGLQRIGYELGALHLGEEDGKTLQTGKNRTDHRHHAIDAITMVYATRSYSKLINTLKARGINLSYAEKRIPSPYHLKNLVAESLKNESLTDNSGLFYNEISAKVKDEANISIKYDTDLNGQLLKDTTYTILCEKDGNLVFLTKKQVSGLDAKNGLDGVRSMLLDKSFTEDSIKIYEEKSQIALLKCILHNKTVYDNIQNNLGAAEVELNEINKKLMADGKKPLAINLNSITRKALEMTGGTYYQLSNHQRQKVFVLKEPSDKSKGIAIDTGRNLCIDLFYTKDGKLDGEIIRKVNASDKNYVPLYKKMGFEFVERLYQGDTLEVDMTDSKVAFMVKTPIANNNRTIVRIDTFTEIPNGIQIKVSNIFKSAKANDGSFTISSMQKLSPRKVVLSALGFPTYVSRVLENRR